MAITMKRILEKFNDCDMFSLTSKIYDEYYITQEEMTNALNKIKEIEKNELIEIYNEEFINYIPFENLYNDIEKECYDFYNDEKNKKYYINKIIKEYKKEGISENEIEKLKETYFECSFIADEIGKKTKYGQEKYDFFYKLYSSIANNIDRENSYKGYNNNKEIKHIEQLPNILKKHLLYYEVSFYNSTTISHTPMINYYFILNEETKKYLLEFRNDFCIMESGLEDLTLYKDKQEVFSSCSHECFNSLEINYKNMTNDEIIDFINDEYPDNNKIVNIIIELIEMPINTEFKFKDFKINIQTKEKICQICDKINLELISPENKSGLRLATINGFEEMDYTPAIWSDLDDTIIKRN